MTCFPDEQNLSMIANSQISRRKASRPALHLGFRYYPPSKHLSRSRRATAVIAAMITVVVACIAAVYAFRWYLVYGTSGSWGEEWGGVIASVLNSIQIQILDMVYKKVAIALTGLAFGAITASKWTSEAETIGRWVVSASVHVFAFAVVRLSSFCKMSTPVKSLLGNSRKVCLAVRYRPPQFSFAGEQIGQMKLRIAIQTISNGST